MRETHLIQTCGDLISRVLRVLLVGLLIGSASSLIALAMIKFISFGGHRIAEFENTHPGVIAVLMIVGIPAIGGLIVGHIVQHMTDQRPHNPADVILAAQSNLKLASLKLKDGILNFIASIISLVSGASLGQYGPIVNMGATLSAHLNKITRTDHTVLNWLRGCGCYFQRVQRTHCRYRVCARSYSTPLLPACLCTHHRGSFDWFLPVKVRFFLGTSFSDGIRTNSLPGGICRFHRNRHFRRVTCRTLSEIYTVCATAKRPPADTTKIQTNDRRPVHWRGGS